jgi:predicted transcriptional regulator
MNTKLVKDFMTIKHHLISFKPDTRIHFVIKTLIQRSISGAPVIDENDNLVGIISEKDCLKVLMEMAMHDMPGGTVEKYMSTSISFIEESKSIMDAVQMFQDSNFRRFPVVKDGKLVGLITRRDILRAIEEIRLNN